MTWIVLIALLLQGSVGLRILLAWRRAAPVSGTAYAHAAVAVAALALWVCFLAGSPRWTAWTTLAVLLAGNFLGDLLLITHVRGRTGSRSTFFGDYGAAVMAVLRGQHPRLATIHAAGAGVVTLLCLIGCLVG